MKIRLLAAFRCFHQRVEVVTDNHVLGRGCGQCGGGFGLFAAGFDHDIVTLLRDMAHLLCGTTGPCGDQTAHDDVFFEANQLVALALNRCFGQNPRGFLERGRRDEAAGLQRRLGDTQQDRLALGGAARAAAASASSRRASMTTLSRDWAT